MDCVYKFFILASNGQTQLSKQLNMKLQSNVCTGFCSVSNYMVTTICLAHEIKIFFSFSWIISRVVIHTFADRFSLFFSGLSFLWICLCGKLLLILKRTNVLRVKIRLTSIRLFVCVIQYSHITAHLNTNRGRNIIVYSIMSCLTNHMRARPTTHKHTSGVRRTNNVKMKMKEKQKTERKTNWKYLMSKCCEEVTWMDGSSNIYIYVRETVTLIIIVIWVAAHYPFFCIFKFSGTHTDIES